MTTTDTAGITAYLSAFERAAKRRNLKEAGDLTDDVRQHIEEAQSSGQSWGEIRAKLGGPDALARAYAAELLFGEDAPDASAEPRAGRPNLWALFGLATGGSLVTLIVASTLGSIAFGFAVCAAILLGVGLPIALGAPQPDWVTLTGGPWLAVALSPVFAAGAWVATKGLAAYLSWFGRSLRAALPGRGD